IQGKVVAKLERDVLWKGGQAFSPDGTVLAGLNWGPEVSIWKSTTGRVLSQLKVKNEMGSAVAFSPNGQTLATAEQGGPHSVVGNAHATRAVARAWTCRPGHQRLGVFPRRSTHCIGRSSGLCPGLGRDRISGQKSVVAFNAGILDRPRQRGRGTGLCGYL